MQCSRVCGGHTTPGFGDKGFWSQLCQKNQRICLSLLRGVMRRDPSISISCAETPRSQLLQQLQRCAAPLCCCCMRRDGLVISLSSQGILGLFLQQLQKWLSFRSWNCFWGGFKRSLKVSVTPEVLQHGQHRIMPTRSCKMCGNPSMIAFVPQGLRSLLEKKLQDLDMPVACGHVDGGPTFIVPDRVAEKQQQGAQHSPNMKEIEPSGSQVFCH